MAEPKRNNLREESDAFESQQLAAVEALHHENPEVVDLDLAEELRIISAETRERIESALPNHLLLFQRALAKERRESPSKVAFKRAFQAVYGKFLIEDRDMALESETGPLLPMLEDVLRFPVTEKDRKSGLKGRNELRAAIKRLRLVESSRRVDRGVKKEVKELGRIKVLKDNIDASGTNGVIDTAKGRFVNLDHLEALVETQTLNCFSGLESMVSGLGVLSATNLSPVYKDTGISKAYAKCVAKVANINAALPPVATMLRELIEDLRELEKLVEDNLLDGLTARIEKLEAKQAQFADYQSSELTVKRTLELAFKASRSPAEMKTFERTHQENEDKGKKLRAVYSYFATNSNLKELEEGNNALNNLMAEPEIKKMAAGGTLNINQEILKLEQVMESKKSARANLRNPADAELRKELDRREEAARKAAGATGFDRDAAKKAILGEVENSREQYSTAIAEAGQTLSLLQKVRDQAIKFRENLLKLIENLKGAAKFEIYVAGTNINAIETDMKAINPDRTNFNPKDLLDLYAKFGGFFENGTKVNNLLESFDEKLAKQDHTTHQAKRKLDTAMQEANLNKNLTDAQAAKRIIEVLVADQYPDLPLDEQRKMATLILANDLGTAQIDGKYEELAQRGSAEVLDTVRLAGFKEKLIGFRYKVDEKVQQPFKGLKPENFKDWASIERLFNIGRLNHQTGFFVLAALEVFEGDTRSIQYVRTEKKLKELLAEQLDVEDRLDESGVVNIVNEAFKAQLEQARSLVQAYFNYYDSNSAGLQENKVRELNVRYEKLREESRLGKIKETVYKKRLEALIKEAKERDLMDQVDFSQSTVLADFWNSDDSEWLRGSGAAVGKYAKEKAFAVGKGGLRLTGRALSGTISVGASLAGQTLMAPFRLAKYPVLAAAKPLVWFVNLFRSNKFVPINISQAVVTDVGRVTGYFKQLGTETLTGAKTAVTTIPGEEWRKEHFKAVGYKERTKVDVAALEEQAKELQEKAEATPVEVAGSPFIDLKKYKKQVEQLDKILATKPIGGVKTEAA